MPNIGMSVPGASDLGLGDRVNGETDEERRRRLLRMNAARLLPSLAGASALAGPAGYGAAGGMT